MSEEVKNTDYVLKVENLHTCFHTESGDVNAVNGLSMTLEAGKTLGIVGESGSGKSVTAYSIMQILAETGEITEGSVKYKGEDLSLIHILEKEKRTARFVCAIAAVLPNKEVLTTRGTIEGYIGEKPVGKNGFGYDPIFYGEEYGCSTAELSMEQKNELRHRGKALRALKEELKKKGF